MKLRLILAFMLAGITYVTSAQEGDDGSLLTTKSGLQVKTTLEGNGEIPQDGDMVKVHYTGKLLDGKVFDSSVSRNKPFEFELGAGRVIKGWDEGFKHIRKGGKATLIIPPGIGYGERDMGSIPPNSTLIFDVELLDFTPGIRIEKYNTEGKTLQTTASGLKYYVVHEGGGEKASKGRNVKIHYSGYLDEKILDSSIKKKEPLRFMLGKGMVMQGLDEGVALMSVGDKFQMIIPPEIGLGKNAQGLPPNSVLTFDVELLEVLPEVIIEPFDIKGKKIYSTESGLEYIIVKEGKGVTPKPGQEVFMNYTGYLEDGTIFDSSLQRDQVFTFPLGQGKVIKGWEEAVALMKVGDKMRLIIPPALAYGDREMGSIPANSRLIFDIELLNVK
jgi:peptidylprolyl isomerase